VKKKIVENIAMVEKIEIVKKVKIEKNNIDIVRKNI